MNIRLALALTAGGIVGITSLHVSAQPIAAQPGGAVQQVVRYDGHRSVRVTVRTPRELMTVLGLTDDVLTCEGAGIGTFDVRMSPEQYVAFVGAGIQHEVLIENLQAHIDAWKARNEAIRRQDGGWYDVFRNLAEIETRVDELAAAHPALTHVSLIGHSVENLPIRMLRITGPGPVANRPAIVINGTQHSRESLSPMTTMYFAEYLLSNYATDPRIQALVNGIDFHFIPVVNPDGYTYVWSTDPMWRKNRSVNAGSSCRGVDLNRNWGHQWGNNNGSSPNACNDTFRGPSAFSEPETQAISAIIAALGAQGRMRAHMDVHSYATQILSPWGYTTEPPPRLPTMDHLGRTMRDAIATHRGTFYQYGQGSIILYIVSGGSRDYTYGVHGAMGWTIELPGTSFHPPANQILPVGQETTLGLLALADFFLPAAQMFTLNQPSIATAGEITPVEVGIENAVPGSERIHYRIGSSGAFTTATPANTSATYFRAELPAAACGQSIQYYFSAQGALGGVAFLPPQGPSAPFSITAYEPSVAYAEGFESGAPGWSVTNHPSLTAGAWERAIPIGALQNNIPSAPFSAAEGQYAFVTQNGLPGGAPGAADVDGGPTILISPTIDIQGAVHAEMSLDFWHYSVGGTVDVFDIDLSDDNGQTWVNAATFTHASGWRSATIRILDHVSATSQVRARFISVDNPNNSVTESGVDNVRVRVWTCESSCYANCDESSVPPILNVDDFTCFINRFALGQTLPHAQQITHYANCDGSTVAPVLNIDDFTCFINAFALGCP